jgi:hypothetical protein
MSSTRRRHHCQAGTIQCCKTWNRGHHSTSKLCSNWRPCVNTLYTDPPRILSRPLPKGPCKHTAWPLQRDARASPADCLQLRTTWHVPACGLQHKRHPIPNQGGIRKHNLNNKRVPKAVNTQHVNATAQGSRAMTSTHDVSPLSFVSPSHNEPPEYNQQTHQSYNLHHNKPRSAQLKSAPQRSWASHRSACCRTARYLAGS